MKTKKEMREDLFVLVGETTALNDLLDYLHNKRVEATNKMFELSVALKKMEEKKGKPE